MGNFFEDLDTFDEKETDVSPATIIPEDTPVLPPEDTDTSKPSTDIEKQTKKNKIETDNTISICKDLTVNGVLIGNIQADEITLSQNSMLKGNVTANRIILLENSVLIGSVHGDILQSNGAIQGDVFINEELHLAASSIIQGNVKTKSLNLDNGAIIDGSCQFTHTKYDSSVFQIDLEKMIQN